MKKYLCRALLLLLPLGLAGGCAAGDDAEAEREGAASASTQNAYADAGYSSGLDSAPVTVVEFSDFGCPYCAQFALSTYPDLHSEFVLSGQVRWVFVPFVSGLFPNSEQATVAAECAGEQNRFWPMHDAIYEEQPEWRRGEADDAYFLGLAREASVEVEAFQRCLEEDAPRARIQHNNGLARAAGIRGTPSFIINGRLVQGALPPEHFRTLLEWAVLAAE